MIGHVAKTAAFESILTLLREVFYFNFVRAPRCRDWGSKSGLQRDFGVGPVLWCFDVAFNMKEGKLHSSTRVRMVPKEERIPRRDFDW
jgi:hypothetical protein